MDHASELINRNNNSNSFEKFNIDSRSKQNTNLLVHLNEQLKLTDNLNTIKQVNRNEEKNKTLCATFTSLMQEYLMIFQNHNVNCSNANSPIDNNFDLGSFLSASERFESNHVLAECSNSHKQLNNSNKARCVSVPAKFKYHLDSLERSNTNKERIEHSPVIKLLLNNYYKKGDNSVVKTDSFSKSYLKDQFITNKHTIRSKENYLFISLEDLSVLNHLILRKSFSLTKLNTDKIRIKKTSKFENFIKNMLNGKRKLFLMYEMNELQSAKEKSLDSNKLYDLKSKRNLSNNSFFRLKNGLNRFRQNPPENQSLNSDNNQKYRENYIHNELELTSDFESDSRFGKCSPLYHEHITNNSPYSNLKLRNKSTQKQETNDYGDFSNKKLENLLSKSKFNKRYATFDPLFPKSLSSIESDYFKNIDDAIKGNKREIEDDINIMPPKVLPQFKPRLDIHHRAKPTPIESLELLNNSFSVDSYLGVEANDKNKKTKRTSRNLKLKINNNKKFEENVHIDETNMEISLDQHTSPTIIETPNYNFSNQKPKGSIKRSFSFNIDGYADLNKVSPTKNEENLIRNGKKSNGNLSTDIYLQENLQEKSISNLSKNDKNQVSTGYKTNSLPHKNKSFSFHNENEILTNDFDSASSSEFVSSLANSQEYLRNLSNIHHVSNLLLTILPFFYL